MLLLILIITQLLNLKIYSLIKKMILDTVNFEGNLGAAYFFMIVGAIGIIAIGVYIILKMLFYIRRKSLEAQTREN